MAEGIQPSSRVGNTTKQHIGDTKKVALKAKLKSSLKKKSEDKKPPLGSGKRFAELKGKLAKKGASNPGALAAFIGRKKFGAKKFAKLSATGRKDG